MVSSASRPKMFSIKPLPIEVPAINSNKLTIVLVARATVLDIPLKIALTNSSSAKSCATPLTASDNLNKTPIT